MKVVILLGILGVILFVVGILAMESLIGPAVMFLGAMLTIAFMPPAIGQISEACAGLSALGVFLVILKGLGLLVVGAFALWFIVSTLIALSCLLCGIIAEARFQRRRIRK